MPRSGRCLLCRFQVSSGAVDCLLWSSEDYLGGGYNVVAGLIGIARRRISHRALSFPPFVSVLLGDYAKAPTMDMPAAVEKNCVSLLHCYTNIGDSNCVDLPPSKTQMKALILSLFVMVA